MSGESGSVSVPAAAATKPVRPAGAAGAVTARRTALSVLVRVDVEGAYADAALASALTASGLDRRDRALATELVHGVTRRRRALDWSLDAFLVRPPPPLVRAALRMGAYQLLQTRIPSHAAVSATVAVVPRRFRGLVNAVLRRVARAGVPQWPDEPTRLSYPDWIYRTLVSDLGADTAVRALEAMNTAAVVHRRSDGYVQDISSQLVTDAVEVAAGDLVADLCAAPGGKASALAGRGALVAALDVRPGRARIMMENAQRLGAASMLVLAGDGRVPPLRPGRFDLVLVDAPCSGLGVLRRRPDARWRIERSAVERLAGLQVELLGAAFDLLRPGGRLIYSVCTLTAAETLQVAACVSLDGRLEALGPPPSPWLPHGTGGMLLPDDRSDGMAMFSWRRRR